MSIANSYEISCRICFRVDLEGDRGSVPLPPGISQVAIGFLRKSGTDPWVQLLLEEGLYGSL